MERCGWTKTIRPVSPTFQRRLLGAPAIEPADAQALVASARAIKRRPDGMLTRLRGKNIALLCARPECDCALRFDAAASALGARVARIEPAPAWLGDGAALGADTARLLESLYDAVDCEEVPPGFARRLQAQLGVPVYDGLARVDHPIFRLLPDVAGAGRAPDDDDRRALLQATLVETLL
jgi:ornithine carbamoyltransferase